MYTLKLGGGNNLTIMYLPDNKQVIVASYQEIGIGDDCQFKQIVVLASQHLHGMSFTLKHNDMLCRKARNCSTLAFGKYFASLGLAVTALISSIKVPDTTSWRLDRPASRRKMTGVCQ